MITEGPIFVFRITKWHNEIEQFYWTAYTPPFNLFHVLREGRRYGSLGVELAYSIDNEHQ